MISHHSIARPPESGPPQPVVGPHVTPFKTHRTHLGFQCFHDFLVGWNIPGHFAPKTPGHFGSYSHTFPHFQHLDRIHGTIVLSTYMNGWIFTGFQVGDYTNPMDPVMGTPWHLPICTSQSLSPASQPKSSGNSSTKMVRVRPLVWRLCFFSGKNNQRQEKKCFHALVFCV